MYQPHRYNTSESTVYKLPTHPNRWYQHLPTITTTASTSISTYTPFYDEHCTILSVPVVDQDQPVLVVETTTTTTNTCGYYHYYTCILLTTTAPITGAVTRYYTVPTLRHTYIIGYIIIINLFNRHRVDEHYSIYTHLTATTTTITTNTTTKTNTNTTLDAIPTILVVKNLS